MAILDLGRRGAHSVQLGRWAAEDYEPVEHMPFEEPGKRCSKGTSAEVLVFLGAGGGVGKSTIALLSALMCAQQGLRTTLIEADVTFGDFQLWLGLKSSVPSVERCVNGPYAVNDYLGIYKAPSVPRVPTEMTDVVCAALEQAREVSDVVIVDTATTWNELTARLVARADRYLIVMDERPSTAVSAIKAAELALGAGVPSVSGCAVYNRWHNKLQIAPESVQRALGCEAVYTLPNGREEVEFYLSNSAPEELLASGNVLIGGIAHMLEQALEVHGKCFAKGFGRRRGWGLK